MRIAFATSTRADWGILSPLAIALREIMPVEVLATNMHLLEETGMTVKEIEADGFDPIRILASGTPPQIAAQALEGFARQLHLLKPDALVILGDRFEMLAVAQAALLTYVPVVHIAGGAVSLGAIDNACRNAISQLSALHLCETERYRNNLIHMGIDPDKIVVTGALGLHSLTNFAPLSREELSASVRLDLSRPTLLITLHAATIAEQSPQEQYRALLQALDGLEEMQFLFTYPNNDVDPGPLIAQIQDFVAMHPGRSVAIPSLGRLRYHSALRYVLGVVGNSSSGLVEVPSAGIPTLDIRPRQDGRDHGPSVLRVDCTPESIAQGLRTILSPEFRAIASQKVNPYYHPDSLQIMTTAITDFLCERSS